MEPIMKSVTAFLLAKGIKFRKNEDETAIFIYFGGKSGNFLGLIHADEDDRALEFVTPCPIKVPQKRRGGVAELLARINYGLRLGHFDLDMQDGEIRCRTSAILGKTEIGDDLIEHILFANMFSTDVFFPAIAAVATGHVRAEQAMEQFLRQNAGSTDSSAGDEADRPDLSATPRFGGRLGDLLNGRDN